MARHTDGMLLLVPADRLRPRRPDEHFATEAAAAKDAGLDVALIDRAGLTPPGSGISTATAMEWELVLTAGLVSVILGTASGAQQIGPLAAIGVGGYVALAGLWGSPVSGASMNPVRSLGPALVLEDWTSWWAYLAGPVADAVIAVGISYVLRSRGGGRAGVSAAQGTLGAGWHPGPRPRP